MSASRIAAARIMRTPRPAWSWASCTSWTRSWDLGRWRYPYGQPAGTEILGGYITNGLAKKDREDANVKYEIMKVASIHQGALQKQIVKEGLSEYFIYTIEGTETIPNTWGKRLPSFESSDIPVTSLCKYDEERWGIKPMRFLSFTNDTAHRLGQTPLPDGFIRGIPRGPMRRIT